MRPLMVNSLSDCSYTCHYRCRPFIQLDCSTDGSLLPDQEDFSVDSIETDTNVVRNESKTKVIYSINSVFALTASFIRLFHFLKSYYDESNFVDEQVKADGQHQIVHCCPLSVSVPYVLRDAGFIAPSFSKHQ